MSHSVSIGPSLPPGLAARLSGAGDSEEDESSTAIGPVLPSNSKNADSATPVVAPTTMPPPQPVIGPCMPPPSYVTPSAATDSHTYGPVLPPPLGAEPQHEDSTSPTAPGGRESPACSESEESEEEVIGPMPYNAKASIGDVERRKLEIEARSQAMKDKLTGKDLKEAAAPKREEWMTELPTGFKPLGIGARKFRTHIPEMGDRSVWTDTPADKRRKAEEARTGRKIVSKKEQDQARDKKKKAEYEYESVTARDKEMATQVLEYNKEHRSKSLMDIHRKRKAEELKAKGDSTERRPFDRDVDLEAPRSLVTPSKRMALMNDSKLSLNTKFHHGSRSFL